MAFLYKIQESSIASLQKLRPISPELEAMECALKSSTTFYVGNLSFYTSEEQIYELFSKCGEIKRIIMGLDKFKKTPCGFCFVEYYQRGEAEDCLKYINGTKLDDRIIRIDWDVGFKEGRQYGRGKSGGQVRDEYRTDFDSGRGGYGKLILGQIAAGKVSPALINQQLQPPQPPSTPSFPGETDVQSNENEKNASKRLGSPIHENETSSFKRLKNDDQTDEKE